MLAHHPLLPLTQRFDSPTALYYAALIAGRLCIVSRACGMQLARCAFRFCDAAETQIAAVKGINGTSFTLSTLRPSLVYGTARLFCPPSIISQ